MYKTISRCFLFRAAQCHVCCWDERDGRRWLCVDMWKYNYTVCCLVRDGHNYLLLQNSLPAHVILSGPYSVRRVHNTQLAESTASAVSISKSYYDIIAIYGNISTPSDKWTWTDRDRSCRCCLVMVNQAAEMIVLGDLWLRIICLLITEWSRDIKYLDANNKLSGLFWSPRQSWGSGCLAGSLDSGKRNGDGWFAVTEADPQNARRSQLTKRRQSQFAYTSHFLISRVSQQR